MQMESRLISRGRNVTSLNYAGNLSIINSSYHTIQNLFLSHSFDVRSFDWDPETGKLCKYKLAHMATSET